MTAVQAVVLLICALIGWGLVSWLFAIIRQQRAPPIPMSISPVAPPALPAPPSKRPNELASSWHLILGVGEHASAAEIDQAYRARLAECDQARSKMQPETEEWRETELRRARIQAAYDFIRPLRPM
jgi:DnaJ-domain-containing protein 1